MEFLAAFLPIVLYILLIVLIIVLVILVIRMIGTLSKVDKVVDDVNVKVRKLDGVFNIVDTTADALSLVSDKFVGMIANFLLKVFTKKSKKKEEDSNE